MVNLRLPYPLGRRSSRSTAGASIARLALFLLASLLLVASSFQTQDPISDSDRRSFRGH